MDGVGGPTVNVILMNVILMNVILMNVILKGCAPVQMREATTDKESEPHPHPERALDCSAWGCAQWILHRSAHSETAAKRVAGER